MSEPEAPKKRIGRPAKAIGKRQSYAFRMNDPIRALVAAAAEVNGRSLSEEIESRVARSFELEELLKISEQTKDEIKGQVVALERIDDLLWPTKDDKIAGEVFSASLAVAVTRFKNPWRENDAVIHVTCSLAKNVLREFTRSKSSVLGLLLDSDKIKTAEQDLLPGLLQYFSGRVPPLLPLEPQRDPARWSGRARVDVIFRDKATGETIDTVTGPEFDIDDPNKIKSVPADLIAARDKHLARRDEIDVDTVLVHILKDDASIWDAVDPRS